MRKKSRVSPTYYEGEHICGVFSQSYFGEVQKIVKKIFGEDHMSKYKLPKIVVMGNESTGKSSLLENITKCQLFPRDYKSCTKCPLVINLSPIRSDSDVSEYSIEYKSEKTSYPEKKDLYKKICEIMDTLSEIHYDEIKVNICEDNLPNIEFVDLPGIVAYPTDRAERTIALCKKYIDNNSIILCVIPAITPRITSAQSISLITQMNLSKNCIVALTMCDKLQEDDIDDLLIDRLTGKSDELENLNFAGFIGVINRTHKDLCSLKKNDSIEKKWIENILSKEHHDNNSIIEKMGIDNMLQEIDNLYKKYIVTNWKQKVLDDLNNEIKKTNNEIIKLGPLVLDTTSDTPDTINHTLANNILTYIVEKIQTNKIIEIVIDISWNNYFSSGTCSTGADVRNTYKVFSNHMQYLDNFINNIDPKYKGNKINDINEFICRHIDSEFENCVTFKDTYVNLKRFTLAKNALKEILSARLLQSINSNIEDGSMKRSIYNTITTNMMNGKSYYLKNILTKSFFGFILVNVVNAVFLPDTKYIESTYYARIRCVLNDKKETMNGYINSINKNIV